VGSYGDKSENATNSTCLEDAATEVTTHDWRPQNERAYYCSKCGSLRFVVAHHVSGAKLSRFVEPVWRGGRESSSVPLCAKPPRSSERSRGPIVSGFEPFPAFGSSKDVATPRADTRSRCTIEECTHLVFGQGLCRKHWQRVRKYGDPHAMHVPGRKP